MLDVTMQRLNGATARRFVSNGEALGYVTLTTPTGGTVAIIDRPDMAEAIADAINGVLAARAGVDLAEEYL